MPPRSPLSLHVSLRWRHDVLALRKLDPDADVSVGELAPIPCPPELLGFVFARAGRGAPIACAPAGSPILVRRAGGSLELVEGPAEIPLAAGDVAELAVGAFVAVAAADAPEALPRSARRRGVGAWAIALAALAHAVILGLAAHDARASIADREDDQTDAIRRLLASAEQRTRASEPLAVEDGSGKGEGQMVNGKRGDGRAGGGARASGAEGKMGERLANAGARGRFAVPAQMLKDPSPSTARAEAIADASAFGIIGLLAQGPHVPSAPFADDFAHGADLLAARGSMWSRRVGEAFGEGGLGLSGIGEGGGGEGDGIGLGRIGTLGHTDGRPGPGMGGDGSPINGFGISGGWGDRLHGSHRVRSPVIRCWFGDANVSGRLPPEVIQRIVRQNFGRFRACYENGLRTSPSLAGRVAVRFVIGRDGAVSNVADGGSDLASAAVTSCVVRAFYGLSFPQPEGGIVTVTYPITFSPE
jgi:hypothetical protein